MHNKKILSAILYFNIIIMAFLTKTTTVASDTDKLDCEFLEFSKGEFVKWNKEKKQNDVYKLDNFIILDIWYTIKWKVWNDSMNKYTAAYFSNEIREYSEPLYLIKSTFVEWTALKDLKAKWTWTDLKQIKPTEASLNIIIYIFDLNDNKLKAFTLSWANFFDISNRIKWYHNDLWDTFWKSRFKLVNKTLFTKWDKNKEWKEILFTEKELDKLSKLELVGIKKRYKVELEYIWTRISDKEVEDLWLMEISKEIDRYYQSRKEYYAKTYWVIDKKENNYIKLKEKEEEWTKEVQDIKKDRKHTNIKQEEEISIEDIPF